MIFGGKRNWEENVALDVRDANEIFRSNHALSAGFPGKLGLSLELRWWQPREQTL